MGERYHERGNSSFQEIHNAAKFVGIRLTILDHHLNEGSGFLCGLLFLFHFLEFDWFGCN